MIYYKSESRIPSILGSGEVEVGPGVKVDGVVWVEVEVALKNVSYECGVALGVACGVECVHQD